MSLSNVVYRGPCIEPVGASPKTIGPTGFAFPEKTSLYFPLSPYGSIRLVSFPVKRTVRKETGRPLKASAET